MRRGFRALSEHENFEATPTFGGKPRLFSCFYKGECTSCWSLGADTAAGSFVYTCRQVLL